MPCFRMVLRKGPITRSRVLRSRPGDAASNRRAPSSAFSTRDFDGAPHSLVLVNLPGGARRIDLMAGEEIVARGIDDEPEQGGGPWVDVVIDARIGTPNPAQVGPTVVVGGIIVERGGGGVRIRVPARAVRLCESEGGVRGIPDRGPIPAEQEELVSPRPAVVHLDQDDRARLDLVVGIEAEL